jgi:Lar family restriction alleviation protein
MDTTLKPCPFCGSTDVNVKKTIYNKHRQYKDSEIVRELQDKVYWQVECLDCDTSTVKCWDEDVHYEFFGLYKDGKEMAISCWNDRLYEKEEHKRVSEICDALGMPYAKHGDILLEIQRLVALRELITKKEK